MTSPHIYEFDGITLDVSAMRLYRGVEELALEPKSFRLLAFLIENRERVLGKEEIFRVVWQDTAVSDNALTRAIAQIRKVLRDDPKEPHYIATVATVGYRFIGVLNESIETAKTPAMEKPRSAGRLNWRWIIWPALAIVLAAGIGVASWHRQPSKTAPGTLTPVPLTVDPGVAMNPSFSPNGDQIAYDWNGPKQDNVDIYVKTIASDSRPIRLTTDPAFDVNPAWSPDGRTIVFLRMKPGAKFDLMLIPALGGAERRLSEFSFWNEDSRGFKPVWSPDSQWVVVPGGAGTGATLYRVSAETGESSPILPPQDVVADSSPAISPDGQTLVYAEHSALDAGTLWTVHVDSQLKTTDAPRQLPTGGKHYLFERWTPDGKDLLVGGGGAIHRMPASGSEDPEPVLQPGMYDGGSYAISARGNRLAYSADQLDTNIWRIDLTAKMPHPERLIASTARDVYPVYSPDGRSMVFYTNRTGTNTEIWIADADGDNQRQLTAMKVGNNASPRWSPDGRTIVFDSNASGVYQIYTIPAGGGKPRQMTQGAKNNFGGNYSRDGRWIYYTSSATGHTELCKIPAAGGAAIQITHNGASGGGRESFDSKTIYYWKVVSMDLGSVWAMPAEGGAEMKLFDSVYRGNFALTSKGIYYMLTQPNAEGSSELRFYSFATKASTALTPMGEPEYGLDVSPDGRYLSYAQRDVDAGHLMMLENFH